jgi:DNA (cytosine-5)-methyltransferase 1
MIGATFCSGIGAPEMAAPWVDWRLASEIEPFPRAVLQQRFGYRLPEEHNQGDPLLWGDMTEITPALMRDRGIPLPELVVAGTPCFTAGHMVLTMRGPVPIEDIRPGDMVATHKGRFRPVLRVGSKAAEVGEWRGVGQSSAITCTPDHPFYVAEDTSRTTRISGKSVRIPGCGGMEWRAADKTPGAFWSALTAFEAPKVTIPTPHGMSRADVMRLLGWYLGDGWVRNWGTKKAIILGLSVAKVEAFRKSFPMLDQADTDGGTVRRIAIGCTDLCEWIEAHLGCGAENKTVPGWLLADPDRAEVFSGYIATDGHVAPNGTVTANSVSERLARGMAGLAQTLGYVANVTRVATPPETKIDGRVVSQRDYFSCRMFPAEISRKSRMCHGYLLRKVQSFQLIARATVFNIEVAEDNSFTVNGAVVHNCQAFSVAGLRKGTEDARGNLTLKFVEIVHELVAARPDGKLAVLWENVPGVLSDKGNAFGCFLGGLVGAVDALLPEPKPADGKSSSFWKWHPERNWPVLDDDGEETGEFESIPAHHRCTWPGEGMVQGPRARAAWAVLDAQYFGVAQRRRRVFVVVDFGNCVDPAAVLLEPDRLRGDTPPRRETGQGSASHAAQGVAIRGREAGGTAELSGAVSTALRASQGGGDKPHVLAPTDVAPTIPARTNGGGGLGTDFDCDGGLITSHDPAATLQTTCDDYSRADGFNMVAHVEPAVTHSLRGEGFDASEDGTGRGTPLVPVAFDCKGTEVQHDQSGVSPPLRSMGHNNSHQNAGGHAAIAIQERAVCENPDAGPDGAGFRDDYAAYTLEARTVPQEVAFQERGRADGRSLEHQDEVAYALTAPNGGGRAQERNIATPWAVRRLTPTECHRLQGFPDGHCAVTYRGKPAADGPQYKALGNSMAVPCVGWILDRIKISHEQMRNAA